MRTNLRTATGRLAAMTGKTGRYASSLDPENQTRR